MKFQGAVDFSGLTMRVHDPADAPKFLAKIAPAWAQLKPLEEEVVDFGMAMPENRRVWHSLSFALS